MLPIAYYDGAFTPLAEITFSATDLSIHRGYSIFDFFRYAPEYHYVDWYMDRFYKSASIVNLSIPYDREHLLHICQQLLQRNNVNECFIKLILTAGVSDNGFLPAGAPKLLAIATPYNVPPTTLYTHGANLISAQYVRDIPEVKTTNYLHAASLIDKMQEYSAIDILYHDGQYISECSRSNVFIIKNDQIITTDQNILFGITRKKVLSIESLSGTITQRPIELSEVLGADEVFITSTIKKVMPVVRIDNQLINKGNVGPVTQLIMNETVFAH